MLHIAIQRADWGKTVISLDTTVISTRSGGVRAKAGDTSHQVPHDGRR